MVPHYLPVELNSEFTIKLAFFLPHPMDSPHFTFFYILALIFVLFLCLCVSFLFVFLTSQILPMSVTSGTLIEVLANLWGVLRGCFGACLLWEFIWYCSHNQTEVISFGKEDHRDTSHSKGLSSELDLSLLMFNLITGLRDCSLGFSTVKLFFSPTPFCTELSDRKSLCLYNPHLRGQWHST